MRREHTIRMNPFDREPRALKKQVESAVKRVLKSGHYILGPEVEAFEHEWSTFTGTHHTVGVGNGLDALELGMRALGIGPGDEVITTAMTAFATVLAIHRVGATPIIADIEPETALLSLESARGLVTEKTKAVIFVHLYGRAGNMPEWLAFTKEHGLHLIEDCAQAHGARFNGRHVGSFGVFGAFSFYPTKNLGGVGDGGALVSNDQDLADKVRILRNYGQQNRYEHVEWGVNSRLDEMQAAILLARLEWLPIMTARRQRNAQVLRSNLDSLSGCKLLAAASKPEQDVSHLFVVRVRDRETVMRKLSSTGIETLIHYPIPSHRQAALGGESSVPELLVSAEQHSSECLTLPSSPWTTRPEIESLISRMSSVIEALGN